jgi:predicted methyltransferase
VPEAQRAALVQNVAQAIKPGGTLFIIDWRDKPEVPFDRGRHIPLDSLVKLATDAGLVLDAEFHYLKHQVFLRFRKPPQP